MHYEALIGQNGRNKGPSEAAPGGLGGFGMVATDRVRFLFADARALYDDALEMLDQGKIRNISEKAWATTKRATDVLVLAREGEEPQSTGQARRALLRLTGEDPTFELSRVTTTPGRCSCTSTASTTATANWNRRWLASYGPQPSTSTSPRGFPQGWWYDISKHLFGLRTRLHQHGMILPRATPCRRDPTVNVLSEHKKLN